MIEKLTEAAIAFFVISGLAYLIGAGISAAAESALRKRLEGAGLNSRMQKLVILAQRFQQRRQKLLPQLVKLDAELKSARRRQYMVNKRLLDAKVARSQLMRVLGEEDAFLRTERPARKFIAQVVNRHVQRAQMEQKEHPFLSRAWTRTQQVVIWAPTVGDAKVLAEKSFPPATGFFIAEITEPQSEADELTALESAQLAAITEEGLAQKWISDRLFDLLPLMFSLLGSGVVAVQMLAHTRKRLRRVRKLHEGHHNRVGTASRGVREKAAGTLALRRDEHQMRRELERLNHMIIEGEQQAERERAAESQIYVFDERKNMGDQAYLFQISHPDFNNIARNAPDEVVKSWKAGRRYMVWGASEKMATAKASMRFNQDKGYRVGPPAPFAGDPEGF